MRTLKDSQFKEVEDAIKEVVGWYDIWLISKVIEYIEKNGNEENSIRDDVETAYNHIAEQTFRNWVEYEND